MLPLPVARSRCGMFRMQASMAHMPKFTWKQLRPTPDAAKGVPCERSSHGLSFLPRDGGGSRLILYGGERVARTPLEPAEALWAAEGDSDWTWRCLTCEGPPPRVAHAQASVGSAVYIFGGRCGTAMEEQPLNDLWVLDCDRPGKEAWSKVQLGAGSDEPPEPRSFHRMMAIGTNLYVFGGCGASGRLADLHQFDTVRSTWHNLATSKLRGRGGPNLVHLGQSNRLAVVAGFAGKETNDGHAYDLSMGAWEQSLLSGLADLRPRSVSVAISFHSFSAVFGGEVNPSDLGHEGAGGFENDVALLDDSGALMATIPADHTWPEPRGWSDGTRANGDFRFYIFGGLTGDDQNPRRLNDLWQCDVE
ncbi:unnamed protein product [Durusdinium trenchii]|uniref:Uncharacterized protein n=1 Tax=Durusdinium trenchii TaxID=1381693 RepID=A0ABP0RUM0_9DINO